MKLKTWRKEQWEERRMEETTPPPINDISVQRLIDDGLAVLYREIKNILLLSEKGKLDAPTARDLRDHLKLLFELKEREDASLRELSDEDLAKTATQVLNDNKQDGSSS